MLAKGRDLLPSAATNRVAAVSDGWRDPSEVPVSYERWLRGLPLAERTRREYARWVRLFCTWLVDGADARALGADPLSDPRARDYAARDFKRHLKAERRLAPASVNLALAAVDHLYAHLGLERANVRREVLPKLAPRALDRDEQRLLMRATERASSRDRALVVLMLFTALRISEAVALDLDDIRISPRKGAVVIRHGKRDAQREVPLNALVRAVVNEWLGPRRELARDRERALFLSRKGVRLSARAADASVRRVGRDAGLDLSAHVLRHTCLTNLVRQNEDLVMVAEIAGHQKIETTRRYSLPSSADRQAAMERMEIDF
jgi:site-specific recombinase XerD